MSRSNESLEGFTGWSDTSDVDFFAAQQEEPGTSPAEGEEITVEGEETPPGTPPVIKEENFFENIEENEEGEEEEEEIPTHNSQNISILNSLKEKGYINYELEEGEELTDELAEQLLDEGFEDTIEEAVNNKLQELPEDGKNFIKFALKGGNLKDYIKTLSNVVNSGLTSDLDIEEESNQELVVKQILLSEGEDIETVKAQIDFLKDSKRLKVFAEKKFDKWKSDNAEIEAEMLEQQKIANKAAKEALLENKKETLKYVTENEEVKGLKFTKEDRKVLPSYINDRTVKLQNGTTITEMQKELYYDIPKNKEAFMQLAMLLKNRNTDGTFNFDSIKTATTTKVVKAVKENVRRSNVNSQKNQNSNRQQSLADMFK